MINVVSLPQGQKARIVEIEKGNVALHRLIEMGIAPGVEIEVISRHPFRGPLVLQIGGTRLALGRDIAKAIKVEVQ